MLQVGVNLVAIISVDVIGNYLKFPSFIGRDSGNHRVFVVYFEVFLFGGLNQPDFPCSFFGQTFGRSCKCKRTFVQQCHVFTGAGDIPNDVGRQDDDHVAGTDAGEQVPEPDSFFGIETGGWFIHNDDFRIVDQCLGDSQSSFHTTRQSVGITVAGFKQPYFFQHTVNGLMPDTPAFHSGQPGGVIEKFPGFQLGKKTEVLRKVSQHGTNFLAVFHQVESINGYLAATWFHQCHQYAHQCRLTGSVGTKKPEHSVWNCQVNIFESPFSTSVYLVEIFDFYFHLECFKILTPKYDRVFTVRFNRYGLFVCDHPQKLQLYRQFSRCLG